ncbi:MAG: HNH endonuclease signature motif containing protein [Nitrososphaera sp.]
MANRKRFNQTAILRHFKAKCKRCGGQEPDVHLTLHHKDGNSENDSYDNIIIYCRPCHDIIEGRHKKLRDMR